jgi:hypothetical protein
MRNLCVSGLILLLAGQPAFAAASEPAGPIARSVAREAARVAAQPSAEINGRKWTHVMELEAGEKIRLTTAAAVPVSRIFLVANDQSLTVLNLESLSGDEASKARLIDAVKKHGPTIGEGTPYQDASVRIADDGVWVYGTKVAERSQIVEQHAAADIGEVSHQKRQGSARMAALGVVVGLLTAAAIGAARADTPCQPSCGGIELWGVAVAFGLPIAGGYAFWHLSSTAVEEVVYVR